MPLNICTFSDRCTNHTNQLTFIKLDVRCYQVLLLLLLLLLLFLRLLLRLLLLLLLLSSRSCLLCRCFLLLLSLFWSPGACGDQLHRRPQWGGSPRGPRVCSVCGGQCAPLPDPQRARRCPSRTVGAVARRQQARQQQLQQLSSSNMKTAVAVII